MSEIDILLSAAIALIPTFIVFSCYLTDKINPNPPPKHEPTLNISQPMKQTENKARTSALPTDK